MISVDVIDIDKLFQGSTNAPLVVNDWDLTREDEKEKLNKLLYTHYDGEALDIVPTCDCGERKGEFRLGTICKACGTPVSNITERPLESILWMVCPEGVKAFINPMIWNILGDAFKVKNTNLIEYLCNPNYEPPANIPILAELKALFPRSLNYFHDNFDTIVAFLSDHYALKRTPQYRDDLANFIRKYRNVVFCQCLPFPSRIGFVTEASPMGMYADTPMKAAIDAIRTITSINSAIKPLNLGAREAKAAKANSQLAAYYRSFINDTLSGKPGVFRKHIYGGRAHFTARAVITPIVGHHNYMELHLPWGLALNLLKIHVTNKLIRKGYAPNTISQMLFEGISQYIPVIDTIFKELVDESPWLGIPVLLNRNPTLARGSIQQLFVTVVKPDPTDRTISLSNLILRPFNADRTMTVIIVTSNISNICKTVRVPSVCEY